MGRLTSSLVCLDQARLQTCEPVSVHCSGWPVSVFQKRMQRSAVPPPEASRPCWWGDQAMALTAAKCSVYCCTGTTLEWFHTSSCRQSLVRRARSYGLVGETHVNAPCCHFRPRRAAGGLCSTWGHTPPACVPGDGAPTGEVALGCRAAGSPDRDSQTTAGRHSTPAHLATGRHGGPVMVCESTLYFNEGSGVSLQEPSLQSPHLPTRAVWPSSTESFFPAAASHIWT